jgi:hypothetical protein
MLARLLKEGIMINSSSFSEKDSHQCQLIDSYLTPVGAWLFPRETRILGTKIL